MSESLYSVMIPDLEYYLKLINCREGCPVHTDAKGYMHALREGNLLEGYRIARAPNPFASICGMICAAPCEISCRRDRIDKALTIRAQKRYLDEWFGLDRQAHIKSLKMSDARGSIHPQPNGYKVACIGAGVSSLTCAHDLLRLGYSVDIYEMMPLPGGMLTYGVPSYRLNQEIVKNECHAIEYLGAKFIYNTKVGRDITLSTLQKEYDAIFIGIGLWKSHDLIVQDADKPDILRGIDYLRSIAMGEDSQVGEHLIIIGGGNVAFDTARVAIRKGVKHVLIVCLESSEEQIASAYEVKDALEEGVHIYSRMAPIRIERDGKGKICGLHVQKISSLYDCDGKLAPKLISGSQQLLKCDAIMLAIGQEMDFSLFDGWDKKEQLELENGFIKTEKCTGRTTIEGIYSGGDAALGSKLFIHAIRHGQEAALSIDSDLRGIKPYKQVIGEFFEIPSFRDKEYLHTPFVLPRCQESHMRANNQELVEYNYTYEEARSQASRCLHCHINPIFNGELCIKCNGCVDVCPCNCLKLVPVGQLNLDKGEGSLRTLVDSYFDCNSKNLTKEELDKKGTAMLKDENLCIRCGLCAEKCPTHAITMEILHTSSIWIE